MEEKSYSRILDKNYDENLNFEDNQEIIDKIMKKSEIELFIGQFNPYDDESKKKSENISSDKLFEMKTNFGKMVLPDKKTGKIYEKFKMPLEKGEDQKFDNNDLNKLFSNYKQFISFLEKIRKKCIQKFKEYNLKLLIKLHIEQINENNDNLLKNICCKYYVVNPIIIDINKNNYEDNNILSKEKFENFELFITDIINFQKEQTKYSSIFGNLSSVGMNSLDYNSTNQRPELKEDSLKINTNTELVNNNKEINGLSVKSEDKNKCLNDESTNSSLSTKTFQPKIKVLTKIIGTHKKRANYIMELENGYLISGGPNNIILYDKNNSKKKEIKKDHYSICPVKNEKGNIDLVINREDGIYASSFNNNTIEEFFRRIKCDTNSKFCFNLNKSFLVCNNEGFFQYNDILGKIIEIKGNLIKKQQFFGGIKINDYLIALTSNKESPNGEDKICFYNNNSKKIYKDIKGYSFTKSQNSLALISENKEDNKKLLLCACTKYKESQKNGILLIRIQFDDKQEEKTLEEFYETGNFEVHCFCQFFEFENKNVIFEDKNKKHTNLFFVGGYDRDKNRGIIKIYKINYNNENFDKTSIEFYKNIEILNKNKEKNYNEIQKPINCIIQSTNTGKIIFTSFDGNVYLVTSLDINDLKDK